MRWYSGHRYATAKSMLIWCRSVEFPCPLKMYLNNAQPKILGFRNLTHPLNPSTMRQHSQGLREVLPSETEMDDISQNRSNGWDSWCESFGPSWGDEDDSSLEDFAIRAFSTGHPASVGSLLLCFAFSTGDFARYLHAVEQ